MLGSDVGTRVKKFLPQEQKYSGSGRKSSQTYLSTDVYIVYNLRGFIIYTYGSSNTTPKINR
jgi:hypothetical protein